LADSNASKDRADRVAVALAEWIPSFKREGRGSWVKERKMRAPAEMAGALLVLGSLGCGAALRIVNRND